MKKQKQNELILAELGDELLKEKLRLEREKKAVDTHMAYLDRSIKRKKSKVKGKNYNKDNAYMDIILQRFLCWNRGQVITRKLKGIDKELKK